MQEAKKEESLYFWMHGVKRGDIMVDFLSSKIGSLDQKRVLDVGFGGGGISIAFAKKCKDVTSLDPQTKSIKLLKERIAERGLNTIKPLLGDATNLPFPDKEFDIVVVNGVLEWVPYGKGGDPSSFQRKALTEAFRVLKSGGVLYLAIENRWYPFNFLRDPHAHIPLACILPRKIANFVSFIFSRKPYENFIYSYWKLKSLIEKTGFSKVNVYVPLIHYQYPVIIKDLEKRCSLSKEDRDDLYSKYSEMKLTKGLKMKILFLRLVSWLKMAKMFSHGFIVLGYKNNN